MASIKLAKQILRKEIKLKIAALSDEEKRRQSSVVTQLLFRLSAWQESKSISLYLSMKDEVDTSEILRAALAENKKCFIPRYIQASMDMVRLYSEQDTTHFQRHRGI